MVPTKYCLLGVSTFPDVSVLPILGCCLLLGESLFVPHSTDQAGLALVPVFFDRFLLPWFFGFFFFFSVWLLCPLCLGVKLIPWSQNPPWLIQKLHHPLHLPVPSFVMGKQGSLKEQLLHPEARNSYRFQHILLPFCPDSPGCKNGTLPYSSTARINSCLWNAFNARGEGCGTWSCLYCDFQ